MTCLRFGIQNANGSHVMCFPPRPPPTLPSHFFGHLPPPLFPVRARKEVSNEGKDAKWKRNETGGKRWMQFLPRCRRANIMDGKDEKKRFLEKRDEAERQTRSAVLSGSCPVCGGSMGAYFCTSIRCTVRSALNAIGSSILRGRELFRLADAQREENTTANLDQPYNWPG